MEFASESEESRLEFAHGLRIARRWKPMNWADASSWSQVWSEAWSRAKTAAMGVEAEARQFARPWGEVWTRVEAEAWAEAEARGKVDFWWMDGKSAMEKWRVVCAGPEAGALALAGVWAWAQGEPRARGERVPSTLADPSTIRDILSSFNRFGVTRPLWHHSPETRDEYSCIIHFITPITRLPFELLRQIFLIIIDETSGPPLVLMLVCKHWHVIITSIWASLKLGTRTPGDAVTRKLERNQWLLDILVDTDSDRGDFAPSDSDFEAIFCCFGSQLAMAMLSSRIIPMSG